MPTVAEYRERLGPDAPERDEDVEALRNLIAGLAGTVIDSRPPAEEEK